jgi:hypothetical protein
MVLNHIAAIFFFSGPLFYIGLVLVIDPAVIASLHDLFGLAIRNFRRALSGLPAQERTAEPKETNASRRGLRLAGMALVLCGLLFAVVI